MAAAASRESSSPQATENRVYQNLHPKITMRERVRSYWPVLRSSSRSNKKPRSPQVPPRPKLEPAPKRASSMPRVSDSTSAQSDSGATPSTSVFPITIVPAVQIPAPVAVESTTLQTAPEIASDAETLALPGLPGATGDENNPSPVEEEVEPTTNDPYVSAVEDVASREPAIAETPSQDSSTEPVRAATASTPIGIRRVGTGYSYTNHSRGAKR